jgi:hypothetical protein
LFAALVLAVGGVVTAVRRIRWRCRRTANAC